MNPVLFYRDGDGDVLIVMPNTLANLDRLRRLSCDHALNVAQNSQVMIVDQGDEPNNLPGKLMTGIDKELVTRLVPGPGVKEICAHCLHAPGCDGPMRQAGRIVGAVPNNASSVLSEMVARGRVDECPLFTTENTATRGTIRKIDLVDAGFYPVSNARVFTDDAIDTVDLDNARRLGQAFRTLADAHERTDKGWVTSVIDDGFRIRKTGRWCHEPAASYFNDLFFDVDRVLVNVIKSRIRALNSGATRSRNASYRRQHCSRCVYTCRRPPWRQDYPSPLTRERVLDQFGDIDDDTRTWMAMFLVTNYRGRYVSEDTGYRCHGIGRRPRRLESGDWGIEVASLVPGYRRLAVLPIAEYWRESDHRWNPDEEFLARYDKEFPRLREGLDEERLAFLHYALKAIDGWGDEVRFYVDDRRPSRNDILSIELYPDCQHIRVHSDTAASNNGGFGGRGSTLTVGDRPRFYTDYSHPYAEAIWWWTYNAPFACGGQK